MKQSLLSFAIIGLAGASLALGQSTNLNWKLNPTDAQFVRDVMASGQHEIEMAKVALKRSNDPGVKSLAERLVDDHTAAGNKLEEIARVNGLLSADSVAEKRRSLDPSADKKPSVDNHSAATHSAAVAATPNAPPEKNGDAVPATPADIQTDVKNRNALPVDAMETPADVLQGAEFDKAWAKQMVEDHKAAISKFEIEEKQAQNADLHSFVSMTLPTLREHLTQAQALDK